MAGIALIVDDGNSLPLPDFCDFLESVAACKSLPVPSDFARGANCGAAKLDSPCSLHRGIFRELETGSWIMAAGTVIDPGNLSPEGHLEQTLLDYLDQGEQVFSRLDGQFALILHDARDDTTMVVSDPCGLIPIYFGNTGSRFFISTSALAVASAVGATIDDFGIRSFLMYGSTFGSTIWRDVHMLPPATVLRLGRQGVSQSIYWSFDIDAQWAALSQDDAVDRMIDTFSNSLRQSLRREGKLWVSLTGGLDSRTLAALADHCQVPFNSYCHGPSDSRDVAIASKISREMGWEYEYFDLPDDWGEQRAGCFDRVTGLTDGHLDVIKMSRTVREQAIKASQLNASLWGYGGELFRGYYWKQEFWNTGNTPRVDYERLMDFRVIPSNWSILRDGESWIKTLRSEIQNRLKAIGEQQPAWPNTVKLDLIGTALERQICGTTISAVLGEQRVILPYYFKENIRQIFSINPKWRTHGRMFRMILERINPRLADMDIADGGPALPMRLSNFYRFLPYWVDSGEKLLWRMAYKTTGRGIWRRRDSGPLGKAYRTGQWLADTLSRLESQNLLSHEHMATACIFDPKRIQDLVSNAQPNSLANESLLGRILAVEIALRSVG